MGDGRNITACLGRGVKNVKWIEQPENVITVRAFGLYTREFPGLL